MQFVNPYFLFGLMAVSIPILIHLFHFHKFRKVYFTNVRFIRQLKQETRKRARLKHIIVLILRILAVIFLVLAFTQPYIPVSGSLTDLNQRNQVSVYIDNSFSMEAVSGSISLLDIAKNKARELAGVFQPSDQFHLITNDFEGKHNRLVSQDEFVNLVDEISISPIHRNLSEVMKVQSDELFAQSDMNKLLYIITDLQKNSFDWEAIRMDSGLMVYVLPLQADDRRNLYIDTCWFESPVQQVFQTVELKVRLYNDAGSEALNVPLRLTINGMQKGLANVDIPGNQPVEVVLPFINYEQGIQSGVLEITDFPVTYDDRLFFSYAARVYIPVLIITHDQENPYLQAVYGKDTTFILNNVTDRNIDYSTFNNYQLIILNELIDVSSGLSQELMRFCEEGGSVLIFPGKQIDPDSYDQFFQRLGSGKYTAIDTNNTKASSINIEHPVYEDVFEFIPENIDLPSVTRYYPIVNPPLTDHEALMTLQNGRAFLSMQPVGRGKLYLCCVPLDDGFTNFHKHAVFVPTMYNIALLSGQSQKLFYRIGQEESIELHETPVGGDQIFRIRQPETEFEFIPEHRIVNSRTYVYPHDQIRQAGNYDLLSSEIILMGLSFNYDRKESLMDFYKEEELRKQFDNSGFEKVTIISDSKRPFSVVLDEISRGIRLWKWFIVIVLACLAGEVLILRFWK
jgi:hypothetical protein